MYILSLHKSHSGMMVSDENTDRHARTPSSPPKMCFFTQRIKMSIDVAWKLEMGLYS